MNEVLSENKPAVNIPFNQDELQTLFNAIREEKHRLMESYLPPDERRPLTEGRKQNINALWLLQGKIGRILKPKQDPGPPPA